MMIRLLATAGVVWCSAAAGKSSDISIGQMKKKIEAAGLFTTELLYAARRVAGLTSSRGVRICSSRSGVSVATFVVVTGRRRWVLGVREELAMIKLIESKLCIIDRGGDGGLGEGW